jgi:hypothetical protein
MHRPARRSIDSGAVRRLSAAREEKFERRLCWRAKSNEALAAREDDSCGISLSKNRRAVVMFDRRIGALVPPISSIHLLTPASER